MHEESRPEQQRAAAAQDPASALDGQGNRHNNNKSFMALMNDATSMRSVQRVTRDRKVCSGEKTKRAPAQKIAAADFATAAAALPPALPPPVPRQSPFERQRMALSEWTFSTPRPT